MMGSSSAMMARMTKTVTETSANIFNSIMTDKNQIPDRAAARVECGALGTGAIPRFLLSMFMNWLFSTVIISVAANVLYD